MITKFEKPIVRSFCLGVSANNLALDLGHSTPRHATFGCMITAAPAGYTLVEVVVVVGLMAVLSGSISLLARSRDSATSLRVGQSLVASLLDEMHVESEASRGRVTVVVAIDPDTDGFLRTLWLAAETDADSGRWKSLRAGEHLPAGAFLVPSSSIVPGDWDDGAPIGHDEGTPLVEIAGSSFDGAAAGEGKQFARLALTFVAGRPEQGGADPVVVIGGATVTSQGLRFAPVQGTRAVWVSEYGAVIPFTGKVFSGTP
ncbi:MAG: prepilin-type N-terminal cleavage/methylation domain-containing protein [Verrucomicrobia bacterium]|nr:prepilin-type N-terminal cleavage/methylation domain-containing protein [Verrucomicrobiota bacterium]